MPVPFRIEVYEKYPLGGELSDEYYENLGMKPPESEYGYRRTFPLVEMIERPIEIPDNKKEFMIRLWSGEDLTCLGSYDQFCITLQDIELELMVDDEYEPEPTPANAS